MLMSKRSGSCQKKELVMKNKMYLVIITMIGGAVTGFSQAAYTGDMAMQNTMLKQRLDQLDKEVQELRQNAGQQGAVTGTSSRMPVWSNLDIELYGYLKLDASYDTSRIDPGDYAKWVDMENENDNDNQFSLTANETRLGMKLKGPSNNGMVMSGRVEVDFYGAASAENKAQLMMRHAYAEIEWPQERFSIIAGQTSDVISPLIPTTINYFVCWDAGNIGYRRPQFRLTKEFSLADDVDLKLEGAAVRTIGRTSPFTGTESGQDEGFPTLEGRVSVTLPVYEEKLTTIGLSGHRGKEEYDVSIYGNSIEFYSWSLNLDVTQPLDEKFLIRGEFFTGQDLDAYLGGIGQGVTLPPPVGPNINKEIGSTGGWIEATFGPWNSAQYNLGLSMESVDRGDVDEGYRTQNRVLFGNVIYALNQQTDIGLEISHWRTEYRGPGDGESMRVQAALKYKF
jgi:hypothetical protein